MKRYLAMITAGLCFATIGIFVKLIGDSVPIMTVNFFRFFFGFLFIAIFAPFLDKSFLHVSRSDLMKYAFLGLLIAIDFSTYTMAYTLAPISNVVLISSSFPVFVAVFSYFLLKERTDKAGLISFLLAFVGLAIINPLQPAFMAGSLLSLANAVLFAIVVVFMRYIDEKKRIGVVFWFLGFAVLFTVPFPFYYGLGSMQSSFIWILLLGVVSTGIAYLLFNYTLEKMPAEISSIIILSVEPLASICMAVLIISETVALNVILGGILIVGGGVFLEVKDRLLKRY